MDDIIVLILTIIFIVAGIFGQMKKRQLPPEPTGDTIPSDEPFWRTLGIDENEQEEPDEISHRFQPEKEGGRADRYHTAASMMKRQFAPKNAPPSPITGAKQVKKKKTFPLKKAIIYSEILNRKYF